MILRKKPEASLKLRQPLMYRVGLVVALVLITGIMIAFPKFEEREVVQRKVDIILEVTDIPQIEQKIEAAKPPSRPSIPIESENEDLSEDITIDQTTDFDSYTAWEAPPPPPEQHSDEGEGPRVRFIPYDEPPEPIGGFAEIQKNIVYPEIAQEAGIEKDLEDLRKSTQGTLRDIEKVHLPHIDTFVEIEKDPHPSSEEPSNHKQSNG